MTHARGDGVYRVCLQAVLQQQFSTKYIDELLQEPASHRGRRRGRLFRRCGQRWRLGKRCLCDLAVLYELQPAA